MAKSKAEIHPKFEDQVKSLRQQASDAYDALTKGGQVKWLRPEGATSSIFDIESLSEVFDRSEINQMFVDAVKDPEDSGVSGDLILSTFQVDYLAAMERAYRARHSNTRPRMAAHMAGRKRGHGHEKGSLTQTAVEYALAISARAKANGDASA